MIALELNDSTIPKYDEVSENSLVPIFEPTSGLTGKTQLSILRDMFAVFLEEASATASETPIGEKANADVEITRSGKNVKAVFSFTIPTADLAQKIADITQTAETAQANAQSAQTAAETAQANAQSAQTAAETAQAKVPHFGEVSATIDFLPDGSPAEVSVQESGEDTEKSFAFSFKIPEKSGNHALLFGLSIDESGNLQISYADTAPDLQITDAGELIFNY